MTTLSQRYTQEEYGMNTRSGKTLACPHGEPWDTIWVKETHLPTARGVIYRADLSEFDAAGTGALYGGWKPSIFCKRECSRITLEITGVRVERLNEISAQDCRAEGISWSGHSDPVHWPERYRREYRDLWESINGSESWSSNPWVWVVEFKVVKP